MSLSAMLLSKTLVAELQSKIQGPIVTPLDMNYHEERRIFNRAIDKKPALIVKCLNSADVSNTVKFARKHGIPVSIRGSGHGVAGYSLCDDGIVIDLKLMNEIYIDRNARTALAEPGITWGKFDTETQKYGLATTGGTVSTTGISGLTLGGGIGWLHGKFGAACDNLISAEAVTAEGEIIVTNVYENDDLFWGIRGCGSNFGIVTSFKYRLYPVGPILAGSLVYPLFYGDELLRFFRTYTKNLPDDLTCGITFLTNTTGNKVLVFDVCYVGDIDQGYRELKPLLDLEGYLSNSIKIMSYCDFQRIYDNPLRAGMYSYWKANYLKEIDDVVITIMLEYFKSVPSRNTLVMLEHFHGAMTRADLYETAFPNRDATYSILIISNCVESTETARNKFWTQDFFQKIEKYSLKRAYINYLGDEGEERVCAAYGPIYERLVLLKNKYDPTNFFKLNHNIRPKGNLI